MVKQGSIFGPTMCFATEVKVKVNERVDYEDGEIEIGILIYRGDISAAGGPEEVKKGIRNVQE